jgi:hypothetical protein
MPRWSVAGQPVPSPVFIAGLPTKSCLVSVGPPLFSSAPSIGFVLFMSPVAANAHVASLLRLCPSELIAPVATLQLLAPLLAKSVFFSTGSFPAVTRRRPAPFVAALLLTVTFVRLRTIPAAEVEDCRIPPPEPPTGLTVLSEIVTLVNVALCRLFRPPPLRPFAVFPRIRLSLTVSTAVPVALWMPPPSLAEILFGPIVLLLIVSVPVLLIPPPVVAATLSEKVRPFSVVIEPTPVFRPPPLPPAAADAVPLRIVNSEITTPDVAPLTSRTRSTSAPSITVMLVPAPLIVTDPTVMSRSPVAGLGLPPESVPAIDRT